MTAADIDAVAELRVRAWQSAYAGLLPRSFLDAMSVEEDAARRREGYAGRAGSGVDDLVADSGGTLAGWAAIGPDRPEGPEGPHAAPERRAPEVAELYAIYVRPGLLGRGVGRTLADACVERAAQRGFTRLVLWVVEGNSRARRFYERAGFTADGRASTFDVDGPGTQVPLVHYDRPLTPPAPPAPPLTDSGAV